jgi:rRNA-processing protein FCF1
MPLSIIPDTVAHVADTNLFIAFGRQESGNFSVLERIAQQHDITFIVPQRVYEELTVDGKEYTTAGSPIDLALDRGWATLASDLDYANPVISDTMDIVRRYIATAAEKSEDTVEKTDTAIGGIAAQFLERGEHTSVTVYTGDIAARRGIEVALAKYGYSDRIRTVDTFELYDTALDSYGPLWIFFVYSRTDATFTSVSPAATVASPAIQHRIPSRSASTSCRTS